MAGVCRENGSNDTLVQERNKRDIEYYRPISLLLVTYNVLMKVIAKRIER